MPLLQRSRNKPYVSPFVKEASRRAEQRSVIHKVKHVEEKSYSWNENMKPDPKTNGLFDPYLHKEEIFKVRPRKASPEKEVNNSLIRNQIEAFNEMRPESPKNSKKTIKTIGVRNI